MDQGLRDGWLLMNTKRGAVSFETEGGARALRFSTNAMVSYQDATNETLMDGLQALQEKPGDMKRMRALFWAGLGGGALDEAGDIVDEIGLSEAFRLIGEAASLAFPAAPEDASGNPQKGRRKSAA